jgi:mono/diheme cytochrome c family protein
MSRRFGRGMAVTAALLLACVAAGAAGSPDRRLGERLFREGLNARDEPIRALVGMPPTPLNGAPAACGACHALKLGAAASAADAAPDLRWSALVKAAAGRGDLKPYTEQSFGRAVNEGFGPSGNQIGTAMPRYSLSRSEIAALVAFLKSQPAEKK